MNGRIAGAVPVFKFRLVVDMKNRSESAAAIAEIVDQACDNATLGFKNKGFRRASAVLFRVAAEFFTISELLGINLNNQSGPKFERAISRIGDGRSVVSLNRHQIHTIVENLNFLKDLGDTASHPRIPKERFKDSVSSNLDKGRRKLEEVITITYSW